MQSLLLIHVFVCIKLNFNVILTFLTLVLTLNNFVFNGLHYLQIKGCAMGTKCAPNYANLFMGNFEANHIYSRIRNKSILYLRYIDDIFMIWTGTKQQLQAFSKEINNVHQSIKFTVESSVREINFLDTTIYKKGNQLLTKTYKKPTDRPSYLHHTSYHPQPLKKNIPFGQALRLKRINTERVEYEKSIDSLKQSFLKRGYNEQELDKQFKKASRLNRDQLLKYKDKPKTTNQIPFITTYHKNLPKIRSIIDKTWNLLHINDNIKKIFDEKPFVAYRRNRNLRDLIGQTTIVNNRVKRTKQQRQIGKCSPCRTSFRNLCCNQIKNTTTFQSNITKETFQIYHRTNCRSHHVIYLMECKKCKIQYIGKCERNFNERLNKHRSDANNPKPDTIPACKHFSNTHHNFNRDAIFTIIEKIEDQTKTPEEKHNIILRRENFWITKLQTLKPKGMNQELNLV